MKRYKRKLNESYLETQAVDLFFKKLAVQATNQIEDSNYEPVDLHFKLSFSDFVSTILYASDYVQYKNTDAYIRNFLSEYTVVEDKLFQDQPTAQIKKYETILKQNFSKLKLDVKDVSFAIADSLSSLSSELKDRQVKDYWKEYFNYSTKEWISDIEIIVLKKVIKKGYETIIEFS